MKTFSTSKNKIKVQVIELNLRKTFEKPKTYVISMIYLQFTTVIQFLVKKNIVIIVKMFKEINLLENIDLSNVTKCAKNVLVIMISHSIQLENLNVYSY